MIRSQSPITSKLSPTSRLRDDPRLGELVEHDDARSRSPRTAPSGPATGGARSTSPSRPPSPAPPSPASAPGVGSSASAGRRRRRPRRRAPSSSSRHRPAAARRARSGPRPPRAARCRPCASAGAASRLILVDQRLDGHRREVRLHLGRDAVDPQRRSGRRARARPPCAGPGPRAAARGRRPPRRAPAVSVVSMIATRPSSWATAVPGPRRRLDLDLVGGERLALDRDRAVGVDLEPALARRRHHGRDLRPEPLADPGQQDLDAAVDELGLVADELDGLDVGLARISSSSASRSASVAAGQREPQAWRAAGGP